MGTVLLRDTRIRVRFSLKANIHRILLLLMLELHGVAILIWKTTEENAARCGVCIEVDPAPSLSSSLSHDVVLSVVTPASLLTVPVHFIACCVGPKPGTFNGTTCKLDVSLTKKCLASSDSAAQQHVPLECLRIYQLINTIRSSIPVHRLKTTIWPLNDTSEKGRFYSIKNWLSKEVESVSVLSQSSCLVSLQNKITESPASRPYSHHVAAERIEEFTPFCTAASNNGALPIPSLFSERTFIS